MTQLYNLGLDISTSIIGISVFEGKVMKELFYLDLTKTKCMFEKAKKYRIFLDEKLKLFNIEKVYVEETLQSFSRGLSSAKTLMTLAKFNGIISNITFYNKAIHYFLLIYNHLLNKFF